MSADNDKQTDGAAAGSDGKPERRSFFRINQDIVLDYRTVAADVAERGDIDGLFPPSRTTDLLSGLRQVDSESSQLLHSITENNRQIADYLGKLNKKLELLTQHILTAEGHQPQLNTTRVNLSEGGIAFSTAKPVYKGSYIALRLMFLPSYISVVLFARVVRSDSNGDDGHQLAARFHRLQEQQAQILSRQIMQAQQAAKRRQQQGTA